MKIIGCTMKIWTCVKEQKYWFESHKNNSILCTHHHGKSSRINLETTVKTKTHLIKSGIYLLINIMMVFIKNF